jgi:hypothetical protein
VTKTRQESTQSFFCCRLWQGKVVYYIATCVISWSCSLLVDQLVKVWKGQIISRILPFFQWLLKSYIKLTDGCQQRNGLTLCVCCSDGCNTAQVYKLFYLFKMLLSLISCDDLNQVRIFNLPSSDNLGKIFEPLGSNHFFSYRPHGLSTHPF